MTTRVQRWGNSLALRIPKAVADELRLSENSDVKLSLQEGSLVISPSRRKRYSFDELVAGITPENRHDETDWSAPVGREIVS